MLMISADWAIFVLTTFLAVCSGCGAIIGHFIRNIHKRLDVIESLMNKLEDDIQDDIRVKEQQLLVEFKYNLKESNNYFKNELTNLYRLIDNIELRFADRSNFARAKWANLNQVINSLIRYMEKFGYVARDIPLSGADSTLTDENNGMDTNLF